MASLAETAVLKRPVIGAETLRIIFGCSLDLSETPSLRLVPMIIFAIHRSEAEVSPYPMPAFTSQRLILKSVTA